MTRRASARRSSSAIVAFLFTIIASTITGIMVNDLLQSLSESSAKTLLGLPLEVWDYGSAIIVFISGTIASFKIARG